MIILNSVKCKTIIHGYRLKLDVYEDIADDVQELFNTSNCAKDDNRPLPIGKNKCNWNNER